MALPAAEITVSLDQEVYQASEASGRVTVCIVLEGRLDFEVRVNLMTRGVIAQGTKLTATYKLL